MRSAEARAGFDLEAYLTRIGYEGSQTISRALLDALHERHLAAIPFENLDVRLGREIRLDLESLQSKLVARRRGGYCFEQNRLFAAALSALGFEVETLEARVRPIGANHRLARTHMLLGVRLEDALWLADVGFGGDGPLRPVPMDGAVCEQPGGSYRVAVEGALKVLQYRRQGRWVDAYAFGPEPVYPIDYEMANYYTSTHPRSIFVQALTLQLSLASARHLLRGRRYTIRRGEREESRDLTDSEAVALVRERFGLDVGEDEVIRALGEDAAG